MVLHRPVELACVTGHMVAAIHTSCGIPTEVVAHLWPCHRSHMTAAKLDLLQGTLDLMVLQTLTAMGPLHGYGIARRIEHVSGDKVFLNQGTIYASLVRLQQRGWISSEW